MSILATLGIGAFIAFSDSSALLATETIRAGDRVTAYNTAVSDGADSGGEARALMGREVRRTVYAGKAVTMDNTRPPRLVARNQVVTVKYIKGALEISTTARAMEEAGLNDSVTLLNLQSRQLVHGIVQEGGWVLAQ